jgi:hypothetical protein
MFPTKTGFGVLLGNPQLCAGGLVWGITAGLWDVSNALGGSV